VYLEQTVQALRALGAQVEDRLLPFLSPAGWKHVDLAGDCLWLKKWEARARRIQTSSPLRKDLAF
jgi:hypothetical protein